MQGSNCAQLWNFLWKCFATFHHILVSLTERVSGLCLLLHDQLTAEREEKARMNEVDVSSRLTA